MLRNLLCLRWSKETFEVREYINFSSLHLLSMSMGWAWADHHTFRPTIFFQPTFWATQLQLTSVFVWHTVLDDLFQIVACFYTVEQCSATNNLCIALSLQLSKSGFCNLKLCVTFGACKKYFSLLSMLLLPVMPFKLTVFRYDCIIANFANGFSWISRIGSRHWAKANFRVLNLATIYVESFGSFGLPGTFYQTLLHLLL